MKRYYTCGIIGTGTETDPYRPAIEREREAARLANPTFDCSYSAIIPTHPEGHPQAGKPIGNKCLVVMESNNHTVFQGKGDIDQLPDIALDNKVAAMHTPTKNKMANDLKARGFNVDVDNSDGFREVIRAVGKQLDAAFDENKFDVF